MSSKCLKCFTLPNLLNLLNFFEQNNKQQTPNPNPKHFELIEPSKQIERQTPNAKQQTTPPSPPHTAPVSSPLIF
jgi:hypothetical protein